MGGGALGGQSELELQVVVSHHVGASDLTH